MNKPEIIEAYSKMFEITKVDARIELDHFVEFVTKMLAAGETLNIPSFMQIGVRYREAHTGYSPFTKEEIEIPKTAKPYAKCMKGLKDAVAGLAD